MKIESEPVIFLDIDGVLNTGRSMRAHRGRSRPFDPEAREDVDPTVLVRQLSERLDRHQRGLLDALEAIHLGLSYLGDGLPPERREVFRRHMLDRLGVKTNEFKRTDEDDHTT